MADPDLPEHRLVDADALLGFTDGLHELHARVESAAVSHEQRHRWTTRLAAISEGAATDLVRARAQLHRMAAELGRHGA